MANEIPSALLPNEALQPQQAAVPAQAQAAPNPYTIPLLQTETKTILPVEQDKAEVAIRSGMYAPKKDQTFILKSTDGDTFEISGSEVKAALDSKNFRLETTEERRERELQEQYGDASGMVQSFVAGVARGGTLGLSDLAGHANPQLAQTLGDLKDANPITSMLGEAAGFIGGSMLGSTEGSLATRGVVGAAERLGAKAATQVEKAIIKDATKAGLSSKVSASIASKMAQEATVGSLVGAGTLVSENALGKADVNAENLVAAIGMGALVGGAFGASIGIAEAAMPLVKQGVKPVTNLIDDYTSPEKAALEIAGYTPAKAVKLGEKNPQMVKDLPDFLTNEVGLSITDTEASQVLAKIERVKKQSGASIGEKIKSYDEIVEANPELGVRRKDLYQDLATNLDDKFIQSIENTPEGRAKLAQAGKYYEEIVKSGMDGGTVTLKGLQKARQGAFDLGYNAMGMPVDTLEGQMARFAGRYYSDALKAAAKQISDKTGDSALFETFIKDHKNFSYASELLPKIKMKAAKGDSLNPLVLSVMGAAGGALTTEDSFQGASVGALAGLGARSFLRSDLRRNLVVLGKIEKAHQTVNKLTEKAVKGFVNAPIKSTARTVPYSIMNSELAKKFENGKYSKPKNTAEAFANMSDNFARYQQNPEAFQQRVNRTTAGMYKQAPETSTQLDILAVNAALFLGSKLPKRNATPGMLDMFNKPRPPSQLDLKKFEKYLEAVEKPESVFRDMEQGRLSSESVEALKAVYPNLYNQLKDKTLEFVGKNPKMPYSRKLQLGLLLDVPTDESLIPENVLGLQSLFSAENQAEQSMVKPTVEGSKQLNGAEAMATDTQDLSEV